MDCKSTGSESWKIYGGKVGQNETTFFVMHCNFKGECTVALTLNNGVRKDLVRHSICVGFSRYNEVFEKRDGFLCLSKELLYRLSYCRKFMPTSYFSCLKISTLSKP